MHEFLWIQISTSVFCSTSLDPNILKGILWSLHKLDLPEPANSQNEESKRVLHGLCSPPTGKTEFLQAVQATEQQKRQWSHFIFNDNVPATVRINLFVCANHFTSDCFGNEGQYKAGFASTLTLVKGLVPAIREPATAPKPQVSIATIW